MIFALVTSGDHNVWQYLPQPWANFASFAAPKVMSPGVIPGSPKSLILLENMT